MSVNYKGGSLEVLATATVTVVGVVSFNVEVSDFVMVFPI
jgi:hypothetical protein